MINKQKNTFPELIGKRCQNIEGFFLSKKQAFHQTFSVKSALWARGFPEVAFEFLSEFLWDFNMKVGNF